MWLIQAMFLFLAAVNVVVGAVVLVRTVLMLFDRKEYLIWGNRVKVLDSGRGCSGQYTPKE